MAANMPNTSLSANDARILNALFDPETLPSSVAKSRDNASIDKSLPPDPRISAPELSDLEKRQNDIIRNVSSNSDKTTIDDAITQLNTTLALWPNYASAHVNRAMLRRMRMEASLTEGQTIFSAPTHDIEDLFYDLSRAIHLSLPASSPADPVSEYAARILRTAYSHRAYLYLKAVEAETLLNGLSKSELEELASKDFAQAARYGDEVAREMSVRTNPYAKMCGAIVRNALQEEMKSEA
ncbi:hypothetical protein COCVIDRAFT_27804 [Bipolaris victoriae FI3]|uniref:Uncharacterized protein n=2 Tax=Bipolaris TaxID=33194 RepID=W6YF61_COCC2|nr:uncharacterized protein COCCADRAFT_88659 [Bipolaris zeicola 26-R-13]XP_014555189.1 hypothetical protein COCVIDRAFT_27804 [Bipolaris victoriae FI3]EUC36300.1 hypothetical protein COCCADRAFT_88659 [Bipolaris zeicola 26-R-13]